MRTEGESYPFEFIPIKFKLNEKISKDEIRAVSVFTDLLIRIKDKKPLIDYVNHLANSES